MNSGRVGSTPLDSGASGRLRQARTSTSSEGFVAMCRLVVRELWLLGAIGLIAIGASGLLANTMSWVWGRDFVAGDRPGVMYAPWRCAQYMKLVPSATDCKSAALADHFGAVVDMRVAAGVLGIVVLVLWAVALRRRVNVSVAQGTTSIIGLVVFSVFSIVFLFAGIGPSISHQSNGAGQYLSAGIVAGIVALGFAISTMQALSGQTPKSSAA